MTDLQTGVQPPPPGLGFCRRASPIRR
jgi:hypothetical protein